MNLIEAVKSGKRFFRPSKCMDYAPHADNWNQVKWTHEDVLADDWELIEKKVEITRTEFFAAVDRALKVHQSHESFTPMSVRLAQELGLD
jgi:hypothetical protein